MNFGSIVGNGVGVGGLAGGIVGKGVNFFVGVGDGIGNLVVGVGVGCFTVGVGVIVAVGLGVTLGVSFTVGVTVTNGWVMVGVIVVGLIVGVMVGVWSGPENATVQYAFVDAEPVASEMPTLVKFLLRSWLDCEGECFQTVTSSTGSSLPLSMSSPTIDGKGNPQSPSRVGVSLPSEST